MKNLILLSIAVFSACWHNAGAQTIGPSTVDAAGGRGSIGGNEFEWSLGEIANAPSSLLITPGVLQPYPKTNLVTSPLLTNNLRVFPNPSDAEVNMEYNATRTGELQYRLMDIAGRTVLTSAANIKTGVNRLQFNISTLASASYMLQVIFKSSSAADETAVYTIQKLQ